MTDFKHFPLPAEGIELMKQYDALLLSLTVDMAALTEEYQSRAKACQENVRAQMKTVWVKMATLAGVDAQATWDSNEWHVESRYCDSGFAALTTYPRPQHPMAALMGHPPTEEPEPTPDTPQGAPEGETLQ